MTDERVIVAGNRIGRNGWLYWKVIDCCMFLISGVYVSRTVTVFWEITRPKGCLKRKEIKGDIDTIFMF